MNHQDALHEMAVERYLLGELSGASLDSFEEHLFECHECAMDVKAGATFIAGAKTELAPSRRATVSDEKASSRWISWFTNPWVLAPSLAACLLALCFQTFILQPRMKLEVAREQTPAVLNPLILANAGARGDDAAPAIVAPEHGSFAVSLDVPTTGGFASYRCTLLAPDGAPLWQTGLSVEQVRDAVLINVPTDKVREGLNTFLIQGLPVEGGTLVNLARYKFGVKIQK
ncbi:MAG: zf-HC2 domain-containing protein [Edaphobacter sp.]